jgi:hypothetical protein
MHGQPHIKEELNYNINLKRAFYWLTLHNTEFLLGYVSSTLILTSLCVYWFHASRVIKLDELRCDVLVLNTDSGGFCADSAES